MPDQNNPQDENTEKMPEEQSEGKAGAPLEPQKEKDTQGDHTSVAEDAGSMPEIPLATEPATDDLEITPKKDEPQSEGAVPGGDAEAEVPSESQNETPAEAPSAPATEATPEMTPEPAKTPAPDTPTPETFTPAPPPHQKSPLLKLQNQN